MDPGTPIGILVEIELLLEIIRSDGFKEKVLEMGGYEVDETGKVLAQIG
jgi:hypothetical protein